MMTSAPAQNDGPVTASHDRAEALTGSATCAGSELADQVA